VFADFAAGIDDAVRNAARIAGAGIDDCEGVAEPAVMGAFKSDILSPSRSVMLLTGGARRTAVRRADELFDEYLVMVEDKRLHSLIYKHNEQYLKGIDPHYLIRWVGDDPCVVRDLSE
jgi:hypothetical protein